MDNNDTNTRYTITPKQRKAVEAIVSGATYGVAATIAGVNEKTLYRWREMSDFQLAIKDFEARVLDDVGRALTLAGVDAVEVLHEIVSDEKVSDSVRVSAAKAILDAQLRYREQITLEARIMALEGEIINVK